VVRIDDDIPDDDLPAWCLALGDDDESSMTTFRWAMTVRG
jgi:hypothetical protein